MIEKCSYAGYKTGLSYCCNPFFLRDHLIFVFWFGSRGRKEYRACFSLAPPSAGILYTGVVADCFSFKQYSVGFLLCLPGTGITLY